MEAIKREAIQAICSSQNRAESFENEVPSLQLDKTGGRKTFDVHSLSAKAVFEEQTELQLRFNDSFNNYFRFLNSENEIEAVKTWQKQQGETVFIRDCLSGTIALSYNKYGSESGKNRCAYIAVWRAKNKQDHRATDYLVNRSSKLAGSLGLFANCELIAAVPADKTKAHDLPKELANGLAESLGLTNCSHHIVIQNKKDTMKDIQKGDNWFDQKWQIWADANVVYSGPDLEGKSVLLIDDNYQSGVTMMYIAMVLQQAGAGEVYGLAMTKTLGNTANDERS